MYAFSKTSSAFNSRRLFKAAILTFDPPLICAHFFRISAPFGFEEDHGIGASQTVADEWKHTAEIADGRWQIGIGDDRRLSPIPLRFKGNQALPGWPGRRDSFHLVFIWRNSSPLAETEMGHVSKMRHVPIV